MEIFNKTKIQAQDIYNQAYAYVSDKFEQVGKVFTLASAYGQILSVISKLSTMVFYFIEDSVTEQNIQTASRTQSIQGLARLAGHNATRAITATGELSISISKLPTIQGDQLIIPNYTRIKCVNNSKTYILNLIDDQIRIPIAGNQTVYAQVIQGELQSQVFTGDGTPLQSYVALTKGSVLVDNFYVKVYVNGEKWKSYDSIYDMPREGKGYLVKTGISGGIDIYFGNTFFGMAPPEGSEVRVEYLLTGGEGGNIREGQDVSFQWIDSGYSVIGEEVDLNECTTTKMSELITFGSNPEPTSLTRLIAPLTSRSFVLANPSNYVVFLEKFNYFSIIDAYTTFNDAYLDDDNVIYLFLIPDISKRLLDTENYFTVPVAYFQLTPQEEAKVLNVIEDSGSKIVTTVVKIVKPVQTRYVVNVSLITFEGYSQDVIKSTIVNRLSEYFLSLRRRDLVPQSDLVRIIENVEGVDTVNVSFISEANEISKTANPSAPVIGLDEFGNIVIARNELPLIRGGWKDRKGVFYADGIYSDRPCSVNIIIKKTTVQDVNSLIFQQNMNNIMST
jgi:hypothetical protein